MIKKRVRLGLAAVMMSALILGTAGCGSEDKTSQSTAAKDTVAISTVSTASTESTVTGNTDDDQPQIVGVGEKPSEGTAASVSAPDQDVSTVEEPDTEEPGDETPAAAADGSISGSDMSINIEGNSISVGDDFLSYIDNMGGKTARAEEGQACIDGGYDTNYYYDSVGLAVYTLAQGGKQVIYDIYITGGSYSTAKGVTVGTTTKEQVHALYGEPDTQRPASDTYTVSGYGSLSFEYMDDVVSAIDFAQ